MKIYQPDKNATFYLCNSFPVRLGPMLLWQKKTYIWHLSPVMRFWTGYAA